MTTNGKITITKRFGTYEMGHRQHKHKGHCRYIHGHSVSIDVTFSAERLDEIGFIKDFGQMKILKELFTDLLDHTFLICADDPEKATFLKLNTSVLDLRIVPDVSAEGMARYIYSIVMDNLSVDDRKRGVKVEQVVFWEDPKNSATYVP